MSRFSFILIFPVFILDQVIDFHFPYLISVIPLTAHLPPLTEFERLMF